MMNLKQLIQLKQIHQLPMRQVQEPCKLNIFFHVDQIRFDMFLLYRIQNTQFN